MAPQIIETPLKGGLNQRIADPHLPLADYKSVINLRQYKTGSVAKRPGNTKLSNQLQQPNNLGPANIDVSLGGALGAFGSQLLLTNQKGVAVYSATTGTFGVPQPTSEAALARSAITLPQLIQASQHSVTMAMTPAVCTDGTHYFYCWVSASGACFVTIEEIATGNILQDQIQPFTGATNIIWAVPIMVGAQLTVITLDSTGAIKMAAWASPYTSILPTSTATLIASGAIITCMIDAVALDATHFAVSFSTTGVARINAYDSAGTVSHFGNTVTAAGAIDTRLSLAGGTLWMGVSLATSLALSAYDPAALTLRMTNFAIITATIYSFAVLGISGTQCVVAMTYSNAGVQTVQADVVDRTLAAGAGGFVLQAANKTTSAAIASRPFSQNGNVYIWLQVYSDSGASQFASLYGTQGTNQTQWTNILCDTLINTAQGGFSHPMRPLAVDAPRFSFPIAHRNVTLAGGSFAPLSVISPSANRWVTVFATRATAFITGWNRVLSDFAASSRWKSVELNGELLQSSGMVCVYDGQRAFENGFLDHICLPQISKSAGGSLDATKTFWYRYVPMQPDAAGNVHRGIPSSLQSIATDSTNFTISTVSYPLPLTLRTPYPSSSTGTKYSAYYEIYRSQPNATSAGSDIATNFLDVLISGGTYVDAGAIGDLPLASNALCYTFGGALPNGCPPGAKDIVAHQGRAWIIAEDGQTLYFSKQIVDGEAVNFTDSFTLAADVTDLRALASLDDKLIVFSDRRVYYLVGQGPADNGGSNDYQGLQIIQSDVGCIDRRSVVATPEGVFFQSTIGIYFIDRGLEVTYLGQPISDELAAFPVITSAVLHPTQPWVYFTVTNAAGNVGERLVYDYRVKLWYVDTLPGVPIAAARTTSAYYWLDSTGQVWAEDMTGLVGTDNGVYVSSSFSLSSFGGGDLLGWMRATKAQLLFHRSSRCDIIVTTTNDYSATRGLQQQIFWDRELEAFSYEQLQIMHKMVETEALQITVQDVAPVNPSGGAPDPSAIGTGLGVTYFDLSFEFETQAGLYKIPTMQSKG